MGIIIFDSLNRDLIDRSRFRHSAFAGVAIIGNFGDFDFWAPCVIEGLVDRSDDALFHHRAASV